MYLVGHAKGTINYMCSAGDGGFSWKLDGPEAVLSDDAGAPIIKHFKSPDPSGTPRITWQHTDGSTVWGNPIQTSAEGAGVIARNRVERTGHGAPRE